MSDLGNKKVFAANLQRYMDERQISRNDLCHALGFNYSTVAEWLNASKYPRIDKIERMSNYFGILKSDLIEDKSVKPKEIEPAITDGLQEGMDMFSSLSPEERREALGYMRYLRDRREPQK